MASEYWRKPAAVILQDESATGLHERPTSIPPSTMFTQVLDRTNLQRALKKVRQNKGAPGIDGMTVDVLPDYLRQHWPTLRAALVAGTYRPQPVRRVEIPKSDGKKRPLGIPTVVDRFIQQAIAQVLQAQWEPHFHPHSYGFRPQRSAHQAVRVVQANIREGYRELRKRGISVREAWNVSTSAHGPWRLSKTPALSRALPVTYFCTMGLPVIAVQ